MKKLTKQQIKKITNELITFYLYNLTKEMYINDGYYIDMFEFFFVLIDEGTLPEFELNQYYIEIGQEPFRYIPLDNVIENVRKYISEKTLNLKKGATVLNLFEGYITKAQERNMILKQSIDRLYAREISKEEYDKIWKIKEDKRNKSKEDNNNEELNENNSENIKGIIKFPNGMTFESDNLKEEDMEEFQKHLKKIMDKAKMIDPKVMDESLSRLNKMDQEEIEKMNEMAQKLFGNFGSFGNPFGGNVEEIGLDEDNQEGIESDSENGKDSKIDKEKKTLTISDNGIGMDKEGLINNLGTIARSGTKGFLDKLSGQAKKDSALIGQFGVGFYSAFMVADRVVIETKSYREAEGAVHWESEGGTEYSMQDGTRSEHGTEITLYLSEESREFSELPRVREVLEKYCGFMPVAIYLTDADAAPETQRSKKRPMRTAVKSLQSIPRCGSA